MGCISCSSSAHAFGGTWFSCDMQTGKGMPVKFATNSYPYTETCVPPGCTGRKGGTSCSSLALPASGPPIHPPSSPRRESLQLRTDISGGTSFSVYFPMRVHGVSAAREAPPSTPPLPGYSLPLGRVSSSHPPRTFPQLRFRAASGGTWFSSPTVQWAR